MTSHFDSERAPDGNVDFEPSTSIFWAFASERQSIYFRRLAGAGPPWTSDKILQHYRFTNPFRVADRVSQFLISRVIYGAHMPPEDTLFRILLFKLFNRIDTWLLLEENVGELTLRSFNVERYSSILDNAFQTGQRLYSPAYIMPNCAQFGHPRKHRNHLALLEWIMSSGGLMKRIGAARGLRDLFHELNEVPSFGRFLAFQYAIDINYSELTDFSEMDFVVAGPGAQRGIQKLFPGERDLEATIRQFCDDQFTIGQVHGFRNLWGRPLQLIDIQNLFCEVDKYTRVSLPHLNKNSGTRIKQRFLPAGPLPLPYFPPKWNLTVSMESCQ